MIPLGDPVLRLEIITDMNGNGYLDPFNSRASLKLNHTETLLIGNTAMCLATREVILEGRKFTVPEDWEYTWSYRKKPCWTPNKDTVAKDSLVFWYDNDGITQDINDPSFVSQWADKGPNGLTLSCYPTERPGYLESTPATSPPFWIGKKEAIFPDGVEITYLYTDPTVDQFDGAVDAIGFLVVSNITGTAGTNVVLALPGNNASSLYVDYATSTRRFAFGWGDVGNKSISTAVPLVQATDKHILVFYKQAGTLKISLNALEPDSDGIATNTTFDGIFGLGNQGTASPAAPAGMSILEAGMWSFPTIGHGIDFEDMRQVIEGYLAYKYGLQDKLPVSHTYKSEYPPHTTTYATL